MNDKTSFVVRVILISIFLFAGWPLLKSSYAGFVLSTAGFFQKLFSMDSMNVVIMNLSYYLIPALSLMIAAAGVPIIRKIKFSVASIAVFFVIDVLGVSFGLLDAASSASGPTRSALVTTGTIMYQYFALAFSIAVVIIFVGRNPGVLWEKIPATVKSSRSTRVTLSKKKPGRPRKSRKRKARNKR